MKTRYVLLKCQDDHSVFTAVQLTCNVVSVNPILEQKGQVKEC